MGLSASDIPIQGLAITENSCDVGTDDKLHDKPAKCHRCKNYFPIRIVQDWNSLPASIVDSGSLDRFKNALKRIRREN